VCVLLIVRYICLLPLVGE